MQLNSGIYPGKFVRKIVLRAILACACIVFMVQECSEVFTLGCRKYCSSFWNCLEMTNLLGFVMYAVFLMIGAASLPQGSVLGTADVDVVQISAFFGYSRYLLSLNVIASVFKFFKCASGRDTRCFSFVSLCGETSA